MELNLKLQDDDVAERLLSDILHKYANFFSFGSMMSEKYEELYGKGDSPKELHQNGGYSTLPFDKVLTVEDGNSRPMIEYPITHSVRNGEISAVAPNHDNEAQRHVRVLWDIENVQVPKNHRALSLIANLQKFLADQTPLLFGPGIDVRITAFFNPSSNRVPSHVVDELDRAAVELVWVSKKREDADRKIGGDIVCTLSCDILYTTNGFFLLLNSGIRIHQEMQVLKPPERVSFMLISSDNDFRHHIQLLKNTGYEAIVVHNAQEKKVDGKAVSTDNSWQQALELHASKAFHWKEIVEYRGAGGTAHSQRLLQPDSEGLPLPSVVSVRNGDSSAAEHDSDEEEKEADVIIKEGKGRQRKPRRKRFVDKVRSLRHSDDATGDANEAAVELGKGKEGGKIGDNSSLGWRICVCSRWIGPYGFVVFDENANPVTEDYVCTPKDIEVVSALLAGRSKGSGDSNNVSPPTRVYVHYKTLTSFEHCFLARGDVVLCHVEASER